MPTPNVQITHISATQDQKEVTANAAFNKLDDMVNASVTVQVAGNDQLTTTESYENTFIILQNDSALAADFNFDMADTEKRWLTIHNLTGFTATLRNSAGGGVTIELLTGYLCVFYYDGTDLLEIINSFPGFIPQNDSVLINGNLDIWQRGTSFTSVSTGDYTADRFLWVQGGAGVVDILQSASVPDALSNFSLQVDVTTADASLAASDTYRITYRVEGFDALIFGFGSADAKQITLSFYVRSPKTGQHSVGFRNAAANRAYATTYTVAVADTWEKKTVTLTADTSGSWDTGASIGLQIHWPLATGSDLEVASADTWETSDNLSVAGSVNVMDNASNNFHLARVKLELGPAATEFQRRPFGEVLALCQRYYEKTFQQSIAPAQSAGLLGALPSTGASDGAFNLSWRYAVPKRATPTIITYNPSAANANVRNEADGTDTGVTVVNSGESGVSFLQSAKDATDAGDRMTLHATAEAEL